MIVITGATGSIGRALVAQLAGQDVLAVSRKPADLGVRHAVGDFTAPETIGRLLSPGDRLFLNSSPFPAFAERLNEVIDLAAEAGVAQIVEVSVRDAAPGAALSAGPHGEVDEHLRASGVPHAILQPTGFMQNLLGEVRGDRFHGSWGTGGMNYIDARDIAAVAAALLTRPVGASGSYLLTGPESPSHEEIAATMTGVLGRPVSYVDLPAPEMAARLAGQGIPEPFATELATAQATLSRTGWAEITTTVEEVTGRPPRTLAAFLADHADAFLPAS
ncbi:NAD(P)H-binding protein [Nonomuraea sp. NPDC049607]|uniref:NmrA family NAD(P)-binding protein n=1 Tax=Nonomuraea sp. NPDC049607 TaxID=3154732 RepID=UPI0034338EC9